MPPPSPPAIRAITSLATPGPSSRWGIAADCNRLATMARKRHPPRRLLQHLPGTGDHQPNVSYWTPAPRWSHWLMSYERYNQLSAFTWRLNYMDERPIAAGQQNNPTAIVTPPATLHPIVPVVQVASNVPHHDTASSYMLTTAMETIERSTGMSLRASDSNFRSLPTTTTTSGIPSEQLPAVETVSPAVRAAIFHGNDINLATLHTSFRT